jgi:selenide,water dikinase
VGSLDDAAVLRPPGAERSLVFTIDVITPIVDDPAVFGEIAAQNALSDVYAMGGRPELALCFVGFPSDLLGVEAVAEVLAGVRRACDRAGCVVVGGHTMKDSEPKCGLAVIGSVAPDGVWSQRGAEPGDALILTKAIGTGLVGQAIKSGEADESWMAAATRSMTASNRSACEIVSGLGVRAATDVTGFGLLGHLRNLVEASGVVAELSASSVPLLPGAFALAERGTVPGGTRANLRYAGAVCDFDAGVAEPLSIVLADAQTSGGLLLCVPEARAAAALDALQAGGVDQAARVGRIVAKGLPKIVVMP